MATLHLLKIKIFWNKGFDVKVFVHDVDNKNLSHESNYFFWRCSWFKYMALKFYASVTKVLKLKVRKFWGLNTTFVEFTEKKLVGGGFLPPFSHPSFILSITTWKRYVFGVILVRIFPHSDWIRGRITPNTDTFYAR